MNGQVFRQGSPLIYEFMFFAQVFFIRQHGCQKTRERDIR